MGRQEEEGRVRVQLPVGRGERGSTAGGPTSHTGTERAPAAAQETLPVEQETQSVQVHPPETIPYRALVRKMSRASTCLPQCRAPLQLTPPAQSTLLQSRPAGDQA